jgi:cephalosporin hydroxylase
MPVSTATIGIRQPSNQMEEYQPPKVISLGPAFGASVVYGAAQTITVGSALPAGTYLVSATGGGTLDATTANVTVYPVTITGGPTPPA